MISDVIYEIMLKAEYHDIKRLSMTNKNLNKIGLAETFWSKKYMLDFNSLPPYPVTNWKNEYKLKHMVFNRKKSFILLYNYYNLGSPICINIPAKNREAAYEYIAYLFNNDILVDGATTNVCPPAYNHLLREYLLCTMNHMNPLHFDDKDLKLLDKLLISYYHEFAAKISMCDNNVTNLDDFLHIYEWPIKVNIKYYYPNPNTLYIANLPSIHMDFFHYLFEKQYLGHLLVELLSKTVKMPLITSDMIKKMFEISALPVKLIETP